MFLRLLIQLFYDAVSTKSFIQCRMRCDRMITAEVSQSNKFVIYFVMISCYLTERNRITKTSFRIIGQQPRSDILDFSVCCTERVNVLCEPPLSKTLSSELKRL
jgi:hypothetical protein